jgi:tryptophanase
VFIDARRFLPHIPQSKLPGQALAVELYRVGGIRAIELGTCTFGYINLTTGEEVYPQQELVRLAIPRRAYTDRHMRYVAEALITISKQKETIRGMEIIYQAEIMRHFTARFKML